MGLILMQWLLNFEVLQLFLIKKGRMKKAWKILKPENLGENSEISFFSKPYIKFPKSNRFHNTFMFSFAFTSTKPNTFWCQMKAYMHAHPHTLHTPPTHTYKKNKKNFAPHSVPPRWHTTFLKLDGFRLTYSTVMILTFLLSSHNLLLLPLVWFIFTKLGQKQVLVDSYKTCGSKNSHRVIWVKTVIVQYQQRYSS